MTKPGVDGQIESRCPLPDLGRAGLDTVAATRTPRRPDRQDAGSGKAADVPWQRPDPMPAPGDRSTGNMLDSARQELLPNVVVRRAEGGRGVPGSVDVSVEQRSRVGEDSFARSRIP